MPELLIHRELIRRKIRHKTHPKILGSPDIIIGKYAIFLNGCFWHRCPQCFRMPKTNWEYWEKKIDRNTQRDRENTRM